MLFNFKAGSYPQVLKPVTSYVDTATSLEEMVGKLIAIDDARPRYGWSDSATLHTPNGRWVIELLFWPEDYERAIKSQPNFEKEIAGSEFVFYVGEQPVIAEWFSK